MSDYRFASDWEQMRANKVWVSIEIAIVIGMQKEIGIGVIGGYNNNYYYYKFGQLYHIIYNLSRGKTIVSTGTIWALCWRVVDGTRPKSRGLCATTGQESERDIVWEHLCHAIRIQTTGPNGRVNGQLVGAIVISHGKC